MGQGIHIPPWDCHPPLINQSMERLCCHYVLDVQRVARGEPNLCVLDMRRTFESRAKPKCWILDVLFSPAPEVCIAFRGFFCNRRQ